MSRVLALFVALSLAGFSAAPAAQAQQRGKVHRIGFLSGGPPPAPATPSRALEALRQGLRDLGYAEGQNLVIDYRWAEGKVERLPDLAGELVRLKVDLIVAVATPGARAAKAATATIPIVMVAVGDPVGTGLVPTLARPGGNNTGLSTQDIPELNAKRLELLKEGFPGVSRVAFLLNAALPHAAQIRKDIQAAADALGVRLQVLDVRGPEDFEGALAAVTRERVDALMAHPDPLAFAQRRLIVDHAAKHRLPAMYGFREFVDAGGLMAYGPSLPDLFRRAATFVDKVLKGAKPADLPVEQPTKFDLVVNLKTARALGLTIPESVLIRADHVIQ